MNERLSRYWANAKQYWQQMSKKQRWMIIGTVGVTILVIALLIMNFSRTEYAWAFRDMDATDMAAVSSYLEEEGIPYQYGPDGTSIAVPSSMVTQVKVDVASQNLVQNGSQGFGIFKDNLSSFGMTDNEFEVLKQDALSGEIQKQLNTKNGIVSSKVVLALPEKSVFLPTGGEDQASASVSINFQPGFRPDQAFIDSLYNIVRSSVGNNILPIENITITDQQGELLPSSKLNGGAGNVTAAYQNQMQIQKEIEAEIKRNVESFLGQILSRDKVAVSVVSSINFDIKNSEITSYEAPNQEEQLGLERSIQEIQKEYSSTGGDGGAGGVAGTGANDIPGYPGNDTGGGTVNNTEINRTINYELNEVRQSIVSSPYVITDLTIFAGIEPPNPDDPASLSEDTKTQIKNILVNIVGTSLAQSGKAFTNEELQNKVTILTQNFAETGVAAEAGGNGNLGMWLGIGAVALAAAAGGGYLAVRRRRAAVVEDEIAAAAPEAYPSIDFETVSQESHMKKQLEQLAKKKPEEFVNLLRTWLVDE